MRAKRQNKINGAVPQTDDPFRSPDDDFFEDDDDDGPWSYVRDDYDYDEENEAPDDDDDDDDDDWEWESYYGADILLPTTPPHAIIHFIGGTFLGSLPPRMVYSRFLQGLARDSKHPIVIIATPIPFLQDQLRFISPLNHSRKVQTIQKLMRDVYQDVLLEEYTPRELKDVPVIGVGHSLGGRLHVLLNAREERRRRRAEAEGSKKKRRVKGNVLISFNNWKADESVPLLNGVKNVVDNALEMNHRHRTKRKRTRARDDVWEEDDDDDDEFWEEYPQHRPRDKNKSSTLFEFIPPPNIIWDIIDNTHTLQTQKYGHYTIPKNLIVQFDRDELDQSSDLACKLMTVEDRDLKFAFLEGSHLTPCMGLDDILYDEEEEEEEEENGRRRRRRGRVSLERIRKRRKELQNLISSVATYIDAIVDQEMEAVMEK